MARTKRYTKKLFLIDIILLLLTGGAYGLIWMLPRELYRHR